MNMNQQNMDSVAIDMYSICVASTSSLVVATNNCSLLCSSH